MKKMYERKKIINLGGIIGVITSFFACLYEMCDDFSLNSEYKIVIGTLYKGSNSESKNILRFKERFKKKFGVILGDTSQICREAI